VPPAEQHVHLAALPAAADGCVGQQRAERADLTIRLAAHLADRRGALVHVAAAGPVIATSRERMCAGFAPAERPILLALRAPRTVSRSSAETRTKREEEGLAW
jgi:hypothetical protein